MSAPSQLSQIASLPQRERLNSFISFLNNNIASTSPPNVNDFLHFVDAVVDEGVGLVVSRQVLDEFVKVVEKIASDGDETALEAKRNIIEGSLERIQRRGVSFEEQGSGLRLQLAGILEAEEDWKGAAHVLQAIPLESGHRNVSDSYKLDIYIRIVRLLLEDDEPVPAKTFQNRAALLINSTEDKTLRLSFKLNQAKILDSERKFVDAGLRYHEISFVSDLDEGDRMQALAAALNCAVLAPAGPARSRLLGALHRDDRSQQLPHHSILSKMYLDHIIQPAEVEEFSKTLPPHQLAALPPTSLVIDEEKESESAVYSAESDAPSAGKKAPQNVLDRAVMEHNLLSASRIYNNITFSGLGLLLNLRPSAAEAMARTMVQQGRLKGSIDQVEGLIMFEPTGAGGEGVVSNVAAAAEDGEKDESFAPETMRWDLQIRQVANKVEEIAIRCSTLSSMATVSA